MAAQSLSHFDPENRVLNAMSTKTTKPPDRPESIAESDSTDRLADLRRRRTELVDVLAETLLDRILAAPPRAAPAAPNATGIRRCTWLISLLFSPCLPPGKKPSCPPLAGTVLAATKEE